MIVRDGGPIFRANEAFSRPSSAPRAAHGRRPARRRPDPPGRVDGRRPGYSVGMTNFELAQALVRLGAVTAIGARRGRLVDDRFDGELLNRPSDPGGERPVSTRSSSCTTASTRRPARSSRRTATASTRRSAALVQGRPPVDRDGDADGPATDRLHRDRRPGARHVRSRSRRRRSIRPRRPPARRGPLAARRHGARRSRPDLDGEPAFTVNYDARLRAPRRKLVVRGRRQQTIQAGVTLTRPARVLATRDRPGVRVASIALRRLRRAASVHWNGTTRGGRARLRRALLAPVPRDQRARHRRARARRSA